MFLQREEMTLEEQINELQQQHYDAQNKLRMLMQTNTGQVCKISVTPLPPYRLHPFLIMFLFGILLVNILFSASHAQPSIPGHLTNHSSQRSRRRHFRSSFTQH